MSEEIDIGKALKAAISTGKVEFGTAQTEKAVKNGFMFGCYGDAMLILDD